ncbi:putative glycerol kinase 5 [Neocloeon triangulifer]|uniref:putative glycerol kinase 5 n=1 Tax=Neocloeon triangulifer TaxID=2078957 RepID=UPI00286FA80B|nr:putative glycerol kinase 5 [Neocloeon triangulifer]
MTQSKSVPARPRHGEHMAEQQQQQTAEKRFVAALDVGTTTVRCHIFNKAAQVVGAATRQVTLLYPQPGRYEINPDVLWSKVVAVVKEALEDANLTANDVTCMGISTQRSTFVTWSKVTGMHYHNLITWQDVRAERLVQQWDSSLSIMALRGASRVVYWFTRKRRFKAGSTLKLMNTQVTLRLLWVLENVPGLKEAVARNEVMFGTFDTYLVWRLSGGRTYHTDPSSAAATGLFDPFTMQWAGWARTIFRLPASIFPPVGESAGPCLAMVAPHIWGASFPICSSLADQSASMFGSCCFDEGDVKLTMGTGSFLNVNTGNMPIGTTQGMYPLVGWKVGDDLAYLAEGASNDTGTIINWALKSELIKSADETSALASSVASSGGVYFVPAFSGLQAPINDSEASAGFIGITTSTQRPHLVRALLESIGFRGSQLMRLMREELGSSAGQVLAIDGGVAKNDFLAQMLADVTGARVRRATTCDHSALGAAFMAGLAAGIWSSKEELRQLHHLDREFIPNMERRQECVIEEQRWTCAVQRFLHWHRQ